MTLRVDKIGGTSLASAERIRASLDAVLGDGDSRRVVVVSAPAGVTDALLAACAGRSADALFGVEARCRRLLDAVAPGAVAADAAIRRAFRGARRGLARGREAEVLAAGERASLAIVTAALHARGIDAAAIDAAELVAVDSDGSPDLREMRSWCRHRLAGAPATVVVPGFFGADRRGRLAILGRGASDLSATLLAAAVDAAAVTIWTDTPGVLSADPRLVPSAVPLATLTWAECARLAAAGAKVLHPQTVEPVRRRGIPVTVADPRAASGASTRIGSGVRGLGGGPGRALALRRPSGGSTWRAALVLADGRGAWPEAARLVALLRRIGVESPLAVEVRCGAIHFDLPADRPVQAVHDALVLDRVPSGETAGASAPPWSPPTESRVPNSESGVPALAVVR